MFFPDRSDPLVHKWSIQFRRELAKKKLLTPVAITATMRYFAKLKKLEDQQLIQRVLDWYCIHAGEEFIPSVKSSQMFCARFRELAKIMNKTVQEEHEDEIDELSRFIANMWLQQVSWPIEVANMMAAIVQRSRDNWIKFKEKIRLLSLKEADHATANLIVVRNPLFVQITWMELLHSQVGWMEHYNGDPMALAFHPKSKRFKDSIWRAWSKQWTGKEKAMDKLLQTLVKE